MLLTYYFTQKSIKVLALSILGRITLPSNFANLFYLRKVPKKVLPIIWMAPKWQYPSKVNRTQSYQTFFFIRWTFFSISFAVNLDPFIVTALFSYVIKWESLTAKMVTPGPAGGSNLARGNVALQAKFFVWSACFSIKCILFV